MPAGLIEIGEYVDEIVNQSDDADDKYTVLCIGERQPRRKVSEDFFADEHLRNAFLILNDEKIPVNFDSFPQYCELYKNFFERFGKMMCWKPYNNIRSAILVDSQVDTKAGFIEDCGFIEHSMPFYLSFHYNHNWPEKEKELSLAIYRQDNNSYVVNPLARIIWPLFANGDFPIMNMNKEKFSAVSNYYLESIDYFEELCLRANRLEEELVEVREICPLVRDIPFFCSQYKSADVPDNVLTFALETILLLDPIILKIDEVSAVLLSKVQHCRNEIENIFVKPLFDVDLSNLHPVVELPEKLKGYKVDWTLADVVE